MQDAGMQDEGDARWGGEDECFYPLPFPISVIVTQSVPHVV